MRFLIDKKDRPYGGKVVNKQISFLLLCYELIEAKPQ